MRHSTLEDLTASKISVYGSGMTKKQTKQSRQTKERKELQKEKRYLASLRLLVMQREGISEARAAHMSKASLERELKHGNRYRFIIPNEKRLWELAVVACAGF